MSENRAGVDRSFKADVLPNERSWLIPEGSDVQYLWFQTDKLYCIYSLVEIPLFGPYKAY